MYHRFVLGASLPTMLKNAAPYTSRGWSLVWTPTLERQPSRFWPFFETGHANSHGSAVLQRGAVEDLVQTFQTCIPDALAVKPSVMSAWDTFRLVHASRDRLRELWMDAEDSDRYHRDLRYTYALFKRVYERYPQVHTYSTIQSVRKDCFDVLEMHLRRSREDGIPIGIKLVRGAYARRPETHWMIKQETDDAFQTCLDRIWSEPTTERPIRLVLATHNRDNIRSVLERIRSDGHPKNLTISIAQLRGLNNDDWIDEARERGVVPKLLAPFGTVWDSIPYLIRRVRENPSMLKYFWMR